MDKIYVLKKDDEMQGDDDFVAEESRPIIPEGIYQVCCYRIEKSTYKGTPKIYVNFTIIDGEYAGIALFMPMNYYKKVPTGSKYYKQWIIANDNVLPTRVDRMTPHKFMGGIFEAFVKTVKNKFKDGDEEPECFHYSIVECLKKRIG